MERPGQASSGLWGALHAWAAGHLTWNGLPLQPTPHPQELQALIKYIEINKRGDMDWFTIKPTNKEGTHWAGKCWYIHDLVKYEFDFQVRALVGERRRRCGRGACKDVRA